MKNKKKSQDKAVGKSGVKDQVSYPSELQYLAEAAGSVSLEPIGQTLQNNYMQTLYKKN